jgi:hypothetical protein
MLVLVAGTADCGGNGASLGECIPLGSAGNMFLFAFSDVI